jgi:hypothetical protein
MNSNTKGIITVLAVGVVGFLAYKRFVKPNSRKVVKNYLFSIYGYDKKRDEFVDGVDKDYINEWSDAIMKGNETFLLKGVTYITKTGKVKN